MTQVLAQKQVKTQVPFDAQSFIDRLKATATLNEQEGWVAGVDQSLIQSTLTAYQNQVRAYVESHKPNATVGEVLGTQSIIPQNYSILMSTLPYQRLAVGSRFTVIPDQWRWRFQFTLYASDLERGLDNPTLTLNQSLPKLAGKKITLSFSPASPADAELINSLLPKPRADGTPIQPSELPQVLPGYLIHLIAELRVAGQLVAAGGTFTMGAELTSASGLYYPSTGRWQFANDNKPTAGEYQALGLDLVGIPTAQLTQFKDKLTATKNT